MSYSKPTLKYILLLLLVFVLVSCDSFTEPTSDSNSINKNEYLINKKMVKELNNAIFSETEFNKLNNVFSSYKDRINTDTYNNYFNVEKKDVKTFYSYDFLMVKYKIISNFTEINKEENTISFILINNVTKDYSSLYGTPTILDEKVLTHYKFSLIDNKLIDFQMYMKN